MYFIRECNCYFKMLVYFLFIFYFCLEQLASTISAWCLTNGVMKTSRGDRIDIKNHLSPELSLQKVFHNSWQTFYIINAFCMRENWRYPIIQRRNSLFFLMQSSENQNNSCSILSRGFALSFAVFSSQA